MEKRKKEKALGIWARDSESLCSVMGVYLTPVTVVGVRGEDKENFLVIAHVGVVDHGHLLVSIDKSAKADQR